MPERYLPPDSPTSPFLRSLIQRIENLERRWLPLPVGTDPLQTFEDGNPLGDTRFLNFGDGIYGRLIGEDYVEITAATGSGGEFDAIVDGSIAATDTTLTPPVFKNSPGEAMEYLYTTLGYRAHAMILVRAYDDAGGDGIQYNEAADWHSPANVTLFGQSVYSGQSTLQAIWSPMSFKAVNLPNVTMINLDFSLNTSAANNAIGNNLNALFCNFFLYTAGARISTKLVLSRADFTQCGFDSMTTLASQAYLVNCEVETEPEGPIQLADEFLAIGLAIAGGISSWTAGTHTYLDITGATVRFGGGGFNSGGVSLTMADSSEAKTLYFNGLGSAGRFNVTMSGTGCASYDIRGGVNDVTTKPAKYGGQVRVESTGSVDISGPATIDIVHFASAGASSNIKLRGETISGTIARHNDANTSNTFIQFIDADECSILAAIESTGAAGTRKPYDFDASSSNNVLVIAGRGTYANAGTDSGINNRVLPEGTGPPIGFAAIVL